VLPPILDGSTSPSDGLGQLNTVWQQLPEEQRGPNFQ
jgi:hypothetical protein